MSAKSPAAREKQRVWFGGLALFAQIGGVGLAVFLWWLGFPPGTLELWLLFWGYFLTMTGLEIGYHRYFAHRAFCSVSSIKILLAILGSMTMQGPIIWWAAIHHRHHAFTDREGDPHSPHILLQGRFQKLRGLMHAHVGWIFSNESHQIRAADHGAVSYMYRDSKIFKIHISYMFWALIGLLAPAAICGIYYATWQGAFSGFLWAGLVRVFLTSQAMWAVNSVGHSIGSRTYKTRDKSHNSFILALITLGAGWHNNHHSDPRSAFLDHRWWQFDLGGGLIRMCMVIGLMSMPRFPFSNRLNKGVKSPLRETNGYNNSEDELNEQ